MYYKCKVEIPKIKGKIYQKEKNGTVYVEFEYDRKYVPEKRYNIPYRTTIGKACPDEPEMMFPNANYLKYFPDAVLPEIEARAARSSCLRIGASLIVQKIISDYGLDDMLKRIVGRDWGLFMDLVAYSIISENNAAQHYPEYAYNHPLLTEGMKAYSDTKVSDFLKDIGDGRHVDFLNEWNGTRDHTERIYITYDSTNKRCQAGDIEIAEYGRPKDGGDKPVFNFSVAYDHGNREPLFYEDYPGSIVDVSQLTLMLGKAEGYGYRNAGFILDRGYFSAANIRFMDRNGYEFVIMVKGMKNLVSGLIMENKGTFEEIRSQTIRRYRVSGKTVKARLFPTDGKERYFHIYYSASKYASEREVLEADVDRMAKTLKKAEGKKVEFDSIYGKYFDLIYHGEGDDKTFLCGMELSDAVERRVKLCGYFAIVTSEEMTAADAIHLYKSRDASEKLFRGDKSFLGQNCLRVHSDESAEGKIFVEFVALIIRNRIYTSLQDELVNYENRPNYFTVPAALRELQKIEMIRLYDGAYRLDHAVTSAQKNILKAFGVDEQWIKKKAKGISGALLSAPAIGSEKNAKSKKL